MILAQFGFLKKNCDLKKLHINDVVPTMYYYFKKIKTYSVLSGDMSNKMHHFPTDDVVGGKDWRG